MTTLFNQPLNVINVGIALFSDDLKTARPRHPARLGTAGAGQYADRRSARPAGRGAAGREDRCRQQDCAGAHHSVPPGAGGVRPAINVVPGMTRTTILHAGPPVSWENMCAR